MAHKILTIGRKLGSGGRELGERVAESLGIPFFDQNLISMAAERGDLAESYLARFDEKKHNPWMYEMVTGAISMCPRERPCRKLCLSFRATSSAIFPKRLTQ